MIQSFSNEFVDHRYQLVPQMIYLTQFKLTPFDFRIQPSRTYLAILKPYISDSFCTLNHKINFKPKSINIKYLDWFDVVNTRNVFLCMSFGICVVCLLWCISWSYRLNCAECNVCDREVCTIINDKKASDTHIPTLFSICISVFN